MWGETKKRVIERDRMKSHAVVLYRISEEGGKEFIIAVFLIAIKK